MPSQPSIPIPLPTIRPTSPSGASPFALLPHELMAQVFLHLDPHTLYTSIRQLNHQWKVTVEEHVIPTLFRTRQWRVALRIHKKPRRVHPNSQQGVAQQAAMAAAGRGGREESEEARRERVLGTIGAWEDELDASPSPGDLTPPTITEYIPLTLSSLSPSTNTFHFTTGANWYALYEIDDPVSAINDPSFRLDLNFGFAWRFEGDGKEDAPQRAGGWTSLDRENRWLSEFWCSTYDLASRGQASKAEEEGEERVRLNATRLARRRRLPVSLPAGRTSKAKGSSSSNGQKRNPRTTLAWDDAHIEYLHLDVALGTEFFVRRSARANLLLRALEAEAARREEEEEEVLREKIAAAAATASRPATPSQKLSTPSAWATPPKLQKPKATRAAGTPPVTSSASSSKASSPPQASSTPLHNGSTSPPPSSAPSSANSSAFLSPAEQLQLMAKSKAAAKVAGRRSANASTSSRAASRAASRANSRAPSAAPSRAPSRPPSRPGTPSGSGTTSSAAAAAARSPSPSPSPALHSHSASGYSTPGRDRDRDLPFTRAAALAQSTASPYTARALSGYTTPNLATTSNVTLHPALTQARHGGGSMSRGVSADSGYATPTRGATVPAGTSFAARGGGGAQPGGTPFAQFRGRLRRVEGGFERVEEGWGRGRVERRSRRGKGGAEGGMRRKRERSETVTAQRWAGVNAAESGAEEPMKGMSMDDELGPSSPSYEESESEDETTLNGGDAGEFGWQRSAVPYEGEGMMRTWREARLLSSPEDKKGAGKGREASLQGGATAPVGAEVGEIREVRPGVVETEWVWSR